MHSICTPGQREAFTYLQRLTSTLFAPDVDLGSKLQTLFAEETVDFGLDYAFCSRIDREAGIQRFEVVHGPGGRIEAGQAVPLEATYCRKTIERPGGTMAISDARAEGWEDDPAFEEWEFGSYLGATVTVEDDLYGTLCYVDTQPRADPIASEEERLVGMQAEFVSNQLSQWSEAPPHDAVEGVDGEPHITSSEIDTMMDALRSEERRVVLLSLLAASSEERPSFVEQRIGGDHVWTDLYHTHLPRLEQAGYVTYDHDAGIIEKGPAFADIEPLLHLLWEYAQASGE